MADVPIGVFLSGGIDSSCVAVLAQQHSKRRLKTFSIAFEDPTFDESDHARTVARQIGSEHIEERLGAENLLDVVDVALSRLDEPLADPSYLPTFLLSRLASRHVKVALGGDGGTSSSPAMRRSALTAMRASTGGFPVARDDRCVGSSPGLRERDHYQSLEWKLKRFVLRWDDDAPAPPPSMDVGTSISRTSRGGSPRPPGPPSRLRSTATLPSRDDWLDAVLALDFSTYLPGSVLTKLDRASMAAHGLEVRPPILDNEMIRWAFSLPSSLKLFTGAKPSSS